MTLSEAIEIVLADQLLVLALPVFIAILLAEIWINHKRQLGLYEHKDMWASLSLALISTVVDLLPKALAFMALFYVHEANFLGLKDIVGRQWWAWGILLFADDFTYYWFHRLNHEVRLFWAGHVQHHSSVYLNYGTALRQGIGERAHKYFFWIWLPLFGFDPVMVFIMTSVNLIYQYWNHTELVRKLPRPLEWIFNTASHHRVHHASQPRYLDRNHAGIFILWDRIFGTFSEEKDFDPPKYGLTNNIQTHNPFHIITHEYVAIWRDVKRASKWSDKLKYIFWAPGWSHDGPDQRAKIIRRDAAAKEQA
jgi:sterol desaturase/sphingolipid hydroxylase (fatty acid hydroxylase superfamily)